jgi:hypothetical protein
MFNMLNLLTRGAESPETTETTLIEHGELGRRARHMPEWGCFFAVDGFGHWEGSVTTEGQVVSRQTPVTARTGVLGNSA